MFILMYLQAVQLQCEQRPMDAYEQETSSKTTNTDKFTFGPSSMRCTEEELMVDLGASAESLPSWQARALKGKK